MLEGWRAMPRKFSGQVQSCFDHAFDARRKAEEIVDQGRKADFLELEKRWLALAQSYEFSERLTDFVAAATDWRRRFDEWRREREGPGEASRLQKILNEAHVDALFERMWLASIVEFSDDAIISRNVDGIILSWNKGAERLFGYLGEEAIGRPLTITVPPGGEDEYCAILERARRGVQHFEIVRQRKDGSLIDVSLTVSPIGGAGGKVIGISNIARDITERKRSEAQISALTREAEHRAKNLLANVKAMVRLSQSDALESLKEVILGRIEALANVHSLFAQSRWTGAEIGSLVEQELSPYARAGDMRAQTNGPTIILSPDVAQAIAVVLHELATNAAKYGALSVAEGQVRVEWLRTEDGKLMLRWSEAGGPAVNPPTRKGFGIHVMEAMIRDGMRGDVQVGWHAAGLACEIVVPM